MKKKHNEEINTENIMVHIDDSYTAQFMMHIANKAVTVFVQSDAHEPHCVEHSDLEMTCGLSRRFHLLTGFLVKWPKSSISDAPVNPLVSS